MSKKMAHSKRNIRKLISILIPIYNEQDSITILRASIIHELEQLAHFDFEIILVDDGSTDNSLIQLLSWQNQDNRVVIIELSRNFGKESALTAAIEEAQGDAAIILDADLQDPVSLVSRFLQTWQKYDADIVLARRDDRTTDSHFKRWSASGFYKLMKVISENDIPSDVGDSRLIARPAINAINRMPERKRFMKGIMAWVGFKTHTIQYKREFRNAGKSKFNFWKLWNFALDGIISNSTVPVRIWMYLGGLGFIVGLVFSLRILLGVYFYGVDVPGYASTIMFILFFGSLQLMCLGIIGEYIGRIYTEVQERPIYITRQIHRSISSTLTDDPK